MRYNGQEKFDDLKRIGSALKDKAGFEEFVQYCDLKERGLRKDALLAADDFVAVTQQKSSDDQRRIAGKLASLGYKTLGRPHLFPKSIEQWLVDVLSDWAASSQEDATPHRWLGFYAEEGGRDHSRRAIKIDPTDEISITQLLRLDVNWIDYQTHNLVWGLLLGTAEEAHECLSEAQEYADMLVDGERKDNWTKRIRYYSAHISGYQKFKEVKPGIPFPEWAEQQGIEFGVEKSRYYSSLTDKS